MPIAPLLLERPENRLLQLCARGPEKHLDFAETLLQISDWKYLTAKLHFHRLTLLFLHHVQGHESLVPVTILKKLQKESEKILHRNLFLLAELEQLVHLLTENQVRVLAYKGPSLALSTYGTLSLRRFIDIDLVVSPKERRRTFALLKEAGYRENTTHSAFTPYMTRLKTVTDYEMPLCLDDERVLLDLHWSIAAPFESFPLGFESLWKRRVSLEHSPRISTLCLEDLIISLCFHGLKHRWERLEWIGVLSSVIQAHATTPLDWASIEKTMRSCGCEKILYLGLRLANDLGVSHTHVFDVLPENLRHTIEGDRAVSWAAKQIWQHNLPEVSPRSSRQMIMLEDHMERFLMGLQLRRGMRARWRFLVGMMRISLLSLEHSRIALKVARPVLHFLSRKDGLSAQTRSS